MIALRMSVATSSVIERGLGSIVEDGAEVTSKCGAEVAIKSVKYGARNILYLVRVRRPDYLLPGEGSYCYDLILATVYQQ